QGLFHAVPQPPARPVFLWGLALHHGEPPEQLFLLRRKSGRRPDVQSHEQVPSATVADARQTLAPHGEDGSRLRPGPYFDTGGATLGSRDRKLGAESCLAERDGQIVNHVIAV